MEHADFVPHYLNGVGVEIGAFKTPIPGITPTYLDLFETYADESTRAYYQADACNLPYFDGSLDYVVTSHVFEHVANPLLALGEWSRVLTHGGCIYMVLPDRRYTFDRSRPLTNTAHLLEDYRKGVTQCDGTHIDDFVFGLDWSVYAPATPVEKIASEQAQLAHVYRQTVEQGSPINIHFHTFEAANVEEMIRLGNQERLWDGELELVHIEEKFPDSRPDGLLVICHVQKSPWRRWRLAFGRKGLRGDARRLAAPN